MSNLPVQVQGADPGASIARYSTRHALVHLALIVSATAVFALRYLRDFDLTPVEEQLAHRLTADDPPETLVLWSYLFYDAFAFILQRDWFYFTFLSFVGLVALSVALGGLYFVLVRRLHPEVALGWVLGVVVTLPIPFTLLLCARIFLRDGQPD